MKARRTDGTTIEFKAIYRVGELAKLMNTPERTLRRWLLKHQVSVLRYDRTVLVPLVAFRDAFPDLWESIRLERSMRAPTDCPVCGSEVKP